MAQWFYYDENREKVAVTGKELKQLALQGMITPETFIETHDGRTGLAKHVTGLSFPELITVPAEVPPLEVAPLPSTPPEAVNPFAATTPIVSEVNPFTKEVNPFVLATGSSASVYANSVNVPSNPVSSNADSHSSIDWGNVIDWIKWIWDCFFSSDDE